MINVVYSKKFSKHYRKRIVENSEIEMRYLERVNYFINRSASEILKDHKLTGKFKGCRAFSITGDFRVKYAQLSMNEVVFLDIGTHNQVYK